MLEGASAFDGGVTAFAVDWVDLESQHASEPVERDRQEYILQHVKSTIGYRAASNFGDAGEERGGNVKLQCHWMLEMSYQ